MTLIADDHSYIKARMEQIKAERANPSEADQEVVENYLGGDEPAKEPASLTLDWSIYAPVSIRCAPAFYAAFLEELNASNSEIAASCQNVS
jgi:hypothetical protein